MVSNMFSEGGIVSDWIEGGGKLSSSLTSVGAESEIEIESETESEKESESD